jgi:hypothetical protein
MAETHTAETVKAQMQADISAANAKTGASDTTLHDAITRLIVGYGTGGGGFTPSGSVTITENGKYDVSQYAEAVVDVPVSGTETGGLNAKIFTATLYADKTAEATILTNEWFKTIRNNPNAFVILRYLGAASGVASVQTAITANFPIYYHNGTVYNSIVARATTTAATLNGNTRGLNLSGGAQYNGHLNIDTNGRLYCYGNATYPIKAGDYQIVAGVIEML